jgi:hypothetical protein
MNNVSGFLFVCLDLSSVSECTSALGGHACVSGDLSLHGCSSRQTSGYRRGSPSRVQGSPNPYHWTRYYPSAQSGPAWILPGEGNRNGASSLVQVKGLVLGRGWSLLNKRGGEDIVACSTVTMQRSREGTCVAWCRPVNTSTISELWLGNRP